MEAQKTVSLQQTQRGSLPQIAFGKAEWERYFGEVGEEPSLPRNIDEILKGPCPYWAGKRVEETHLLTLIPSKVDGRPLTLNSLGEMIKNPRGGGHKTQYRHYHSGVKEELGEQGVPHSYWILMTRDVISGSKDKTYEEQKALLKQPYAVPKALEAVTAILMHHARSGERLYRNDPYTDTYCQEKIKSWQALSSLEASPLGGSASTTTSWFGYRSYISSYGMGSVWKL